jgi:hypothetical protein
VNWSVARLLIRLIHGFFRRNGTDSCGGNCCIGSFDLSVVARAAATEHVLHQAQQQRVIPDFSGLSESFLTASESSAGFCVCFRHLMFHRRLTGIPLISFFVIFDIPFLATNFVINFLGLPFFLLVIECYKKLEACYTFCLVRLLWGAMLLPVLLYEDEPKPTKDVTSAACT